MSLINFNKPLEPFDGCTSEFNEAWVKEARRILLDNLRKDADNMEKFIWGDKPVRSDGFYPFLNLE